jgi:hypothetical protein
LESPFIWSSRLFGEHVYLESTKKMIQAKISKRNVKILFQISFKNNIQKPKILLRLVGFSLD